MKKLIMTSKKQKSRKSLSKLYGNGGIGAHDMSWWITESFDDICTADAVNGEQPLSNCVHHYLEVQEIGRLSKH